MIVHCPVCDKDVEPAPIKVGGMGFFGAARFCPTPTGPISRCETDLAACVGSDGKRLMEPPTEAKPHELESSLQHRVFRYLDTLRPDVAYWRQSVGKAYTRDGRELWYGTLGQGDILLCVKGLYCEFELKSETGRQQANQKKHEGVVKAAHGRYYLIRSLDEARIAVESVLGRASKGASIPVYEAGLRYYQDEAERWKERCRQLEEQIAGAAR